jgi:hypothetical protein
LFWGTELASWDSSIFVSGDSGTSGATGTELRSRRTALLEAFNSTMFFSPQLKKSEMNNKLIIRGIYFIKPLSTISFYKASKKKSHLKVIKMKNRIFCTVLHFLP